MITGNHQAPNQIVHQTPVASARVMVGMPPTYPGSATQHHSANKPVPHQNIFTHHSNSQTRSKNAMRSSNAKMTPQQHVRKSFSRQMSASQQKQLPVNPNQNTNATQSASPNLINGGAQIARKLRKDHSIEKTEAGRNSELQQSKPDHKSSNDVHNASHTRNDSRDNPQRTSLRGDAAKNIQLQQCANQ